MMLQPGRKAVTAVLIAGALMTAGGPNPVVAQVAPQPQVGPEPTAPNPRPRIPYAGSEIFRFLLYQAGYRPLKELPPNWLDPQFARKTTIIIVDDVDDIHRNLGITPRGLRDFMQNGGSFLVATDATMFTPDRGWESHFGYTVSGLTVSANRNDCYGGLPHQPYISRRPTPAAIQADSPHQIMQPFQDRGPKGVATSNPSGLQQSVGARLPGINVVEFADLPDSARTAEGRRVPNRLLGVGYRTVNDGPKGRGLLIADQSIFVNGLMGLRIELDANGTEKLGTPDNANLEFTRRVIEWLRGTETRTQCLFVDSGQVIDQFAVERPNSPRPPMAFTAAQAGNFFLQFADPIAQELEKQGTFDQLANDVVGRRNILHSLLIAALVYFSIFLFFRMVRSRYRRHQTSSADAAEAFVHVMPRGSPTRQRTQGQFDLANLAEAARVRVRDRFEILGGSPDADGAMPSIVTADDCRGPQDLARRIESLWRLGYGQDGQPIPAAQWDRFNADLEDVLRRARHGDWAFLREADRRGGRA